MADAKPVKILFCIDSLARGGTELQLTGLIDRLDRARFSPHLLTIRPSDPELTPDHCPHLAWNIPRLLSPKAVWSIIQLNRYLREENFQIVQTFFQDSTVFAGFAARLAGVPVRLACFRDLGFWRTRSQALLLSSVYPMMTSFLCNAKIVKQNFIEHDGLRPDKISVIYNGIDIESLPWVEHQGPTLHIGIVGNLTRQVKRTDLFIKAAGIISRQAKYSNITWHIVGDGQLRSELEALAQDEGIAQQVVFAGRISVVSEYLEKLQVGVLCSDSEGFSNALLEYMLKGCACVATAVGGNVEAIKDKDTGLLVPADNAQALADSLLELINDVNLRRELAARARLFCESGFNWEKCVNEHQAIYLRTDPLL